MVRKVPVQDMVAVESHFKTQTGGKTNRSVSLNFSALHESALGLRLGSAQLQLPPF